MLCQWCCLLEVTNSFSYLHCSSALQKQECGFQRPSKLSSTWQWSIGGWSKNVNTGCTSTNPLNGRVLTFNLKFLKWCSLKLPSLSSKRGTVIRIKLIHGNASQEVFYAKSMGTYLKPGHPGLHRLTNPVIGSRVCGCPDHLYCIESEQFHIWQLCWSTTDNG